MKAGNKRNVNVEGHSAKFEKMVRIPADLEGSAPRRVGIPGILTRAKSFYPPTPPLSTREIKRECI